MAIDQVTQIPFYLDWKFWSAVVAFAALVLSQLPPLHIVFRRAKLEAETYSYMHITHKVGNPNAQLHLILNNMGGRELRIRQIELQFRRGNEDSFSLPAKNYLQSPGDKEAVLLASFKLKQLLEFLFSSGREALQAARVQSSARHCDKKR